MWRHNILTQLPERLTPDNPEEQKDPKPFELSTSGQSSVVEIGKDRLTAKYSGTAHHSSDVGAIQSTLPVPKQAFIYYFEMTVIDKGEKGRTTLGFTVKDSKLTSQPGYGAYGSFHDLRRLERQHTNARET